MAKKQDYIIGGIILTVITFFGILFIIAIVGLSSQSDMSIVSGGDKVAVIDLEGIITSPHAIVRQFKKFDKDESVKSIVFRINSPGGGISASQEIYEHVRRVRDGGKPIVASMGTVAASGGYYVALGADAIMANPGTTTGSIGVIAEFPNFKKLMEKIGIEFTVIKSGKFKDTGSPYRDIRPEERQYLQAWIDNGYDQFLETVMRERELPRNEVLKVADGRVYTGEQAKNLALIDTLGTFEDAISLAAELGGIKGEPKLLKERQNKITLYDILTEDIQILLSEYVGLWPEAKYLFR